MRNILTIPFSRARQRAAPRHAGTLLPTLEDVPPEYRHPNLPWRALAEHWLDHGLEYARLHTKPGVDQASVTTHLRKAIRADLPREHKIIALAYMLDLRFHSVQIHTPDGTLEAFTREARRTPRTCGTRPLSATTPNEGAT